MLMLTLDPFWPDQVRSFTDQSLLGQEPLSKAPDPSSTDLASQAPLQPFLQQPLLQSLFLLVLQLSCQHLLPSTDLPLFLPTHLHLNPSTKAQPSTTLVTQYKMLLQV